MVKATLAKEEGFFYTFNKKESRQRRHSGMCGGADVDAGEKSRRELTCLLISGSCCTSGRTS